MRGEDRTSGALFSYVDMEARIGANHPLRAMRRLTNAALAELDPRFSALYEGIGRPSIAPERLLRASLLQLLYSIRHGAAAGRTAGVRHAVSRFVGLTIDEKVFDASTFSKNRDRLLTHAIAQGFLSSLLGLPEVKGLLSAEHFSVDGTLLKAWASMKSFRPKSASTADKDARLYRKGAGQESRLCYLGHALMENRNGLVAAAEATLATGTAEREAAAAFSRRLPKGATLGADKGYDAEAFVEGLKARGIEPHIAINGTGASMARRARPRSRARSPRVCAMPSASGCVSASRKASAGRRRSAVSRRRRCAALPRSAPLSSSPWPPTTSCACPSSWPRGAKPGQRHEEPENNDPTSRQNSEPEPQKIALALLVAQTH